MKLLKELTFSMHLGTFCSLQVLRLWLSPEQVPAGTTAPCGAPAPAWVSKAPPLFPIKHPFLLSCPLQIKNQTKQKQNTTGIGQY